MSVIPSNSGHQWLVVGFLRLNVQAFLCHQSQVWPIEPTRGNCYLQFMNTQLQGQVWVGMFHVADLGGAGQLGGVGWLGLTGCLGLACFWGWGWVDIGLGSFFLRASHCCPKIHGRFFLALIPCGLSEGKIILFHVLFQRLQLNIYKKDRLILRGSLHNLRK